MSSKITSYLTDPTVQPKTPTCRFKAWAHDNAFTGLLIMVTCLVEVIVTVIQCH